MLRSIERIVLLRQAAGKRRLTTSGTTKKDPSISSSSILEWYSRKLDTHPLMTKAVTSGLISEAGDLFSQYIEFKRSMELTFHWDILRTARIGVLGFALVAPVVHYWYGGLARFFPGSSPMVVAKRVVWDQAFFSPLFLPTWLTSLWLLEGQTSQDIFTMLQAEVPTALVANWALWVPAQLVNFRYIPGKFQVLFSNVVALGWNAYLSFTAHEAEAKVEKAKLAETEMTV
jgi:peroxisomal membrane protein 2